MSLLDRLNSPEEIKINSYSSLEEGTYIVSVDDIEIREIPFPEARKYSIEFTVNEGKHKGRKTWMNKTLKEDSSEKAINFFKGTVCLMAGTTSTNGDLDGLLVSTKGNLVEINLEYSPNETNPDKPWTNIYVNKLIAKAGTY